MRPRHHTAENGDEGPLREAHGVASMRPRHHTAENTSAWKKPVPLNKTLQ